MKIFNNIMTKIKRKIQIYVKYNYQFLLHSYMINNSYLELNISLKSSRFINLSSCLSQLNIFSTISFFLF